jgi:hypothetical protein
MNLTKKQLLLTSAILALLVLPLPFVWFEIGPLGKLYYGPSVPDIYILGATILGKDRSFWGINFAYKFQLIVIVYFILSTLWTIKIIERRNFAFNLTRFNLVLLILFPFFLYMYASGVFNNSDGAAADIELHLGIGLLFYILILMVTILTIKRLRNTNTSSCSKT